MKRLTLLTTLHCFFFISMLGQTIPIGKYIGYENMLKHRMTKDFYIPGANIETSKDTTYWFHSNIWFHEVTINVLSDTCVNISKVPLYFENGVKHYSDSIGGYFEYECAKIEQFSEHAPLTIRGKYYIFGKVTMCKYCQKPATAIPVYAHCIYRIEESNNDRLVLSTEFGSLVYKRQTLILTSKRKNKSNVVKVKETYDRKERK